MLRYGYLDNGQRAPEPLFAAVTREQILAKRLSIGPNRAQLLIPTTVIEKDDAFIITGILFSNSLLVTDGGAGLLTTGRNTL